MGSNKTAETPSITILHSVPDSAFSCEVAFLISGNLALAVAAVGTEFEYMGALSESIASLWKNLLIDIHLG